MAYRYRLWDVFILNILIFLVSKHKYIIEKCTVIKSRRCNFYTPYYHSMDKIIWTLEERIDSWVLCTQFSALISLKYTYNYSLTVINME